MIDNSSEFLGKVGVSFFENNIAWIYDEISYGLYKINLITNKIELILNPMQIHKNKLLKIIGIIKNREKIILVPQLISDTWIIYDLTDKKINYIYPFLSKTRITGVKQTEDIAYLIPSNTNESIFLIALNNMSCQKKYDNWYFAKNGNSRHYPCWGVTTDKNNVFFPIVHKNQICKVNKEEAKVITIDIPESILSVGVSWDGIWILPEKGRCIYRSDYNGKILECINKKGTLNWSLEQFIRIVATDEYVFLFPYQGNNIYVYRKLKHDFINITQNSISPLRETLVRMDCSYWDYYEKNGVFHILPMRYRYMVVELSTLRSLEKKLIFEKSCNSEDYWKWYFWISRKNNCMIFEDGGSGFLKQFVNFVYNMQYYNAENNLNKIGKNIWERCKLLS